MLTQLLQQLRQRGINLCAVLGRAGLLLTAIVLHRPQRFSRKWKLLSAQIYSIGGQSLLITTVAGLFIGMVLALQSHAILIQFGVEHALGQIVTLSLLRELGPVVTALLYAGRAGSALTAEIGQMKASEQLASLEMMAIDPLYYVVTPRFWAGVISMPLLSLIFIAVGIWGGAQIGIEWKGIEASDFWAATQSQLHWRIDLVNGVVKSLVFAITTTWIALFNGYDACPTPIGIQRATTRTVVHATLAILGLDFLLTVVMLK